MKIYFYKMVVDNGGAPCVDDGLLSLAICKPIIRKQASIGDCLIGFGGKALDGRLIYIAKVTGKYERGAYYRSTHYEQRGDCIYRWNGDKLECKENAKYHKNSSGLQHDVGIHPDYDRADVLISNDFRYFGNKETAECLDKYKGLSGALEKLGPGHRVNQEAGVKNELFSLIGETWLRYGAGVIGSPSHSTTEQSKKPCTDDDECDDRCITEC